MERVPLVDEAMKKAAVVWLTVPDIGPAYPVWCVWIDGALYVVSGPGEQAAPGLAEATTACVTARGDHGGRIVTWRAAASRLTFGTDEWDTITPQVAAKRLNARGTTEEIVTRWAAGCVVSRLEPVGEPPEAGPTLPDASLAAPPPPTPAARPARRPFRLHRVRKRPR
ncbi:hypothetical protein HC028_03620 [Planosporangium flavigriseum]|uniref:Uncharacterized protein n=1 Tax=Planosporangium flavigriseum TaxID=373681 RepID=A0A8J3PKW3_9ACTN|nr:hypothetical protein [Planosporangium flavigriseum]NJC63601.1 hypothetical protein [Planosporangium flavigriseum]GIG72303.1 hypothetical protein Pfl04_07070 [Planosporangium flavigriseum]